MGNVPSVPEFRPWVSDSRGHSLLSGKRKSSSSRSQRRRHQMSPGRRALARRNANKWLRLPGHDTDSKRQNNLARACYRQGLFQREV